MRVPHYQMKKVREIRDAEGDLLAYGWFADNAGGFYAPWQNVINVTGKEFGGLEGIVYAHQVAHALLDQHFDAAQWGLYPACTRGDDACQALRALIEGDAALTTDKWLEKGAADLNKKALPQYQALPPAIDDPSAPPFVTRDEAFRSEYGRKFVEALWELAIPSGRYRYYDGMLYLMALLHCSGEFRIWPPR